MLFKVRREDGDVDVHGVQELQRLYRTNKISPSDYIYNPTLDKWMYAKDFEELKELTGNEFQATLYNAIGLFSGILGLVVALFSPETGLLLIGIGVLFSILYYTVRPKTTKPKPVAAVANKSKSRTH